MGADLVDRSLAGHPEGDDDAAVVFLDEHLGGNRQVLEARDGRRTPRNARRARAVGELVERLCAMS